MFIGILDGNDSVEGLGGYSSNEVIKNEKILRLLMFFVIFDRISQKKFQ